jgi:hypothetical protein
MIFIQKNMNSLAFLKNTALDYDMEFSDVKYIYEKSNNNECFYENLELFCQERSNT